MKAIILVVYVDDIVVTRDNDGEISSLKSFLKEEFEIKDLGLLKFFLGIGVERLRSGIVISQRKYIFHLLEKTGQLGAKPVDTPLEQNNSLYLESGGLLEAKRMYKRLVGKLIYLTITRPDISYAVIW